MMMETDVNSILYQKTGMTISKLALKLLSQNVGDRIPPITDYQTEFKVSRGTVQNAFTYLKSVGAIKLVNHGHQGTIIEEIDYEKLQENCLTQEILGIMPLPYSLLYEGFATAIYEQLHKIKFNMAYARGALGRIRLVESNTYQFAFVSQYAAEEAISKGRDIEILFDFGPGSFVSKHVLLLRDSDKSEICDGMKVAYDKTSIDQSRITENLIAGKKVKLVEIRIQNTIEALKTGEIDAGVWNYDAIIENPVTGIHIVSLSQEQYNNLFSTGVIVVKKGNDYISELLLKKINVDAVNRIVEEVKKGLRTADY